MMKFTWCDTCLKDVGGSHYHCANCGKESGMYGHYVVRKDFKGFTCESEHE